MASEASLAPSPAARLQQDPQPAVPASCSPASSRVASIWEALKSSSSLPPRSNSQHTPSASTTEPSTSPSAGVTSHFDDVTPRHTGVTSAPAGVQDLLLGRVRSKKAGGGSGTLTPRVFAGPLSWLQGAKTHKNSPSSAEDREPQNLEHAQLRREASDDFSAERGLGEAPDASHGRDSLDQRDGATVISDRMTADVAASALAAAKAATSLVVDTASKIQVKEVRHFAGQAVEVTKLIDSDSKAARAAKRKAEMQAASSRGLDSLLAQIEKKKKLNILDKTRKDWGEFKESTGVVDELEEYKRSGTTYTEKQAFLNRADVRTYEKERDVRLSSRLTGT